MNKLYIFTYILIYLCYITPVVATPRVSIITSLYNGDYFIEQFLEDITRQTIFDQCELILINAHSPGKEYTSIKKYLENYTNIIYIQLGFDPGIYGVWNLGIKLARANYITNANLDDRLKQDCYEAHADYLDTHPDIELVYSGCYMTKKPNETFERNSSKGETILHSITPFNRFTMFIDGHPSPNNHPMWRKSLHTQFGLFDTTYKSSGDMEMWLRAAFVGNAQFAMIPKIYGLYYHNPQGLSTKKDSLVYEENRRIWKTLRDIPETYFDHIEFLD